MANNQNGKAINYCGPILFNAYISDLPKYCQVQGVTIKLFADDLKVYTSSMSSNNLNKPLQQFIEKFINYCALNGLTIAINKCEVLHIGNRNKELPYLLLGKPIKTVGKNQPVRDLGLFITSDLKWGAHIDTITKKARKLSYAILKTIKYSDSKILINLFNLYVRPILEYASNVFNPYFFKDINKLEKIQKHFLEILHKRINHKIYTLNPTEPLPPYQEHLLANRVESLELRRLKSDLVLFHKHLHGFVNIDCHNGYRCSATITRGDKYKIFPAICKTIVRHNSFFVRTSRIYSKLPDEIRHCDLKLFKTKLDQTPFLNKFLKCQL